MTKSQTGRRGTARKSGTKPDAHTASASPRGRLTIQTGDKVLETLAQEFLGVCARALTSFNANPGNEVMAMLQSFPPGAKFARQMLDDAGKASMVHTRWQSNARYLDGEGHPRIIPVQGLSPSFQALCRECGVAARANRLLEWACRFGLCRRVGADRLAYLSDVTLVTGHRALMLARAVMTTDRFLATCAHNAKRRRRDIGPLGDRTTEVRVTDEEFPKVAEAARRFLSSFIESSDRQLLAAVEPDPRVHSAHRRRWCGVTAFVFRDR